MPGESTPELPLPHQDRWETVKIKIPSPWNINGFVDGDGIPGGDFNCYPSYPESWKHVKMGWMRRTFQVPADWGDKTILLHFEAVCGQCQVYIDGKKVGEHFDNSLPETYFLDGFVTPGKDHELWVGVRAPELLNVNSGTTKFTYPTGSFFNMNSTGIWQDVYLLGIPRVRIKDVFVQPDLSTDQLRVQVTIENRSEQTASITANGVVMALQPFSFPEDGIQVVPHYDLEDTPIIEFPGENIIIAADAEVVITLEARVSGKLIQWDIENPNLYAVLVNLEQDEKALDCKYTRFGWREFKIKGGDFCLNGNKIQVKADSWHFMGLPQLTRRYAFAWYKALIDAGGNGVRLHAMPYPTFYLEVADEMGVCVLDESAIWASHCQNNYDEPVTWERYYDHVARLVLRDRNYPSVMGWSVENEVMMALEQPFQTEETIAEVGDKVCKMIDIVRELDPTRDWISADGSYDWDGRFPTCVLHYANKETYQEIKRKAGKPVGVGECTIAYFGTPKHAAKFAGDLAYNSEEDRMKGVAIETYGQLKAQLEADFSYLSVFNLAWYGLKPLPLGHRHQENAPMPEDGVFYIDYQDGKPGVQPERIGPYCTTFNPGYDPDLPLYEPWPMYEAIKTVYSSDGPLPSRYEVEQAIPAKKSLPVIEKPESVIFFGETDQLHYRGLKAAGIQFSEDQAGIFIYADMTSLSPDQEKTLEAKVDHLRLNGGTVFLSGLTPFSERLLQNLTGEKIKVFVREASSLVFGGEYTNTDPLIDHFRLSDLYFSEDDDHVIQRYGIHCEDPENSTALLKSCISDWRLWNHQAETSKTGAIYRSGKELPAANALVQVNLGKARVLLSTIEMRDHRVLAERKRRKLWNRLMQAAGAKIDPGFGKDKSFSSYTAVGKILQNPQAIAVVGKYIPLVNKLTEDMIAEIKSFSLRELATTHGRLLMLSSKKMDKIDQALDKIPLKLEKLVNTTILEGYQIVQVLGAGFSSGSDCGAMLKDDDLFGENRSAPSQGDEIIRDGLTTTWQVLSSGQDGFDFQDMAISGSDQFSSSYMSFRLDSPRDLVNLLIEPNLPKLFLNLETASCLRVWLNGINIFSQPDLLSEPVKSQIPLLLEKGINNIMIKVVNENGLDFVKASLSSTHEEFVDKLISAFE